MARGIAVRSGQPMPRLPEPSAATLDGSADPRGASRLPPVRRDWLRIDLADRLASHAHQVRQQGEDPVDRALATSIGWMKRPCGT